MTSPSFTVRRAVLGDEPILRSLRLEALTEAPEAFCSTYERELARTTQDWQRWLSPNVTVILEQRGMARGLVSGRRDADESGVVHLMSMWLHPAMRGSGAAEALVNEYLGWARDVNAKVVRLDVIAANERARHFYERHGFVRVGPDVAREGDGRQQLRMERLLSDVSL
jgi:ribosomal protein S18 acetylase RimI-like enzyme